MFYVCELPAPVAVDAEKQQWCLDAVWQQFSDVHAWSCYGVNGATAVKPMSQVAYSAVRKQHNKGKR